MVRNCLKVSTVSEVSQLGEMGAGSGAMERGAIEGTVRATGKCRQRTMKHQYPNLLLDRLRFRIGGIGMGRFVLLLVILLLVVLLGGHIGIGSVAGRRRRCQ